MSVTTIRKTALSMAAEHYLCIDVGAFDSGYASYEVLLQAVNAGEIHTPEGICPWAPFEDMPLSELYDLLLVHADALEASFKDILQLAKAGIVHSTIQGRLDGDANTLDMSAMVDLGNELVAQDAPQHA